MVVAAETIEGADRAGVLTVTSSPPSVVMNGHSPAPIVPATVTAKGLSPAAAKATVLLEFVDDWASTVCVDDSSVEGSPRNWPFEFAVTVVVNAASPPQ